MATTKLSPLKLKDEILTKLQEIDKITLDMAKELQEYYNKPKARRKRMFIKLKDNSVM